MWRSPEGPTLRCVATGDGHRLAHRRPQPRARAMPGVIVPRKTVTELRKLLDDDEAQIARFRQRNQSAPILTPTIT